MTDLRELVAEARVTLIGEMHGNTAGPAALLEAAEVALEFGPGSVGLEAPERDTDAFQTFIESDGQAAAQSALLAASFWSPTFFDGRANAALWDTFELMRALRASGVDLQVFGFLREGEYDALDQNPHEQRMANAIVEHAEAEPSRKIVALVGNLHAQLLPFQFGERRETRPMARYVLDRIDATRTIKLIYSGGTTWAIVNGLQKLDLTSRGESATEFTTDASGAFHALWPIGIGVASPSAHPDFELPES